MKPAEKPALFSSSVPILLIAAMLLALGACRSRADRTDKADAYEALYDREMSVRAYPAALQSINHAVKEDENEPRRWLKLAKVQDLVNNSSAAAVSYQRALDLEPSNIEALENLAVLSVRAGQFDLAKQYIDPLLLLQPNDLAGLLASGAVAMNDRRFGDAEKIANTIVGAAPSLEEGYILRARVLELSGHVQDGIKVLEERQAANPVNNDVPRELISMYRRLGDRDGIRRTALRLYTKFPDDPKYTLEAIRAYHAQGQDDQARTLIAKLSQDYAGSISVMTAVAGLWRDIEPRAVAVDRIAAMAAKSPVRVRATLADMLTSMGEPGRAAALLEFVATQPVTVDNVDIHGSYARALYALGRTDELQRNIDALLAFDATNPGGLLLRARLELARGDFMKAANDAAIVASDDNNSEEAALLLASIYATQGNVILAGKAFGEARDNFPDSAAVVDAQTKWLLGQKRIKEATDTAAAYAHAHPRQFNAWQVYLRVCTATQNTTCVAEARRAIASVF